MEMVEELVRIGLQNGISAVDNALVIIPEELRTNVLAICFADKLVQDYRKNTAQIDKSQAFDFAEREINEAISMIRSTLIKEHGGCECTCHLRQITCINGTGDCMAEPIIGDGGA